MALTAKQEAFAQAVASGMTASDAYRANYDCRRMQEKSVHELASRLAADVKVRSRIEVLTRIGQEKAVEKLALSKEWVIQGLMDTIAEARQAVPVLDAKGNPTGEYRQNLAAAVRGYELLGKELGMFVDRKEIKTSRIENMTREELEARADELLAKMGLVRH